MRKPLIAANWKMYKTPKESLAFLDEFLPLVKDHTASEIAIFPTMSSLASVIEATKDTCVTAGAQTMHWLNEGPYTGQTSPTMLESIGCTRVLLGHSELLDLILPVLRAAGLGCEITAVTITGGERESRSVGMWTSVPKRDLIAGVQVALERAVGEVTGLSGFELKRVMRTGTVASVDNRNWELAGPAIVRRLSQSRAVALDMESAAIAANGFRFRVPYGTLLCVSDKPLHGEIKLAGMAGEFYRQRVGQHLEIGLRALEELKSQARERLHSRKLRSFTEVAFQ